MVGESQMYKVVHIYASMNQGSWPTEQGEAFWLKFQTTTPPLIDPSMADLYTCPVLGEGEGTGPSDYLGPASDVTELPEDAYLGGDKPGNHDRYTKGSGNVIRMSGEVIEIEGTEYEDFLEACRP